MCNLFSGHTVIDKGADWGKVLVVTGIHHEKDREDKRVSKYGENLLAWETIEKANVNSGVKVAHVCGKKLSKEEIEAILEITNQWIKGKGNDWFIRIVAKSENNLDLCDCTGLTSLPNNLSVPGNLDLRGCTGLTSLPDNLSVGYKIYKDF